MFNLLIGGVLGIGGLGLFLGIMLYRVPALPLILICSFVMLLLLYDFLNELRAASAKRRG